MFEEDVHVGRVHGGASRALLILSLEAPMSARRGFGLIRLILWHYRDCMIVSVTSANVHERLSLPIFSDITNWKAMVIALQYLIYDIYVVIF